MKNRIKYYIGLTFLTLFLFSCNQKSHELEEYKIISEILNYSYGHEKDDLNGRGWIDLTKPYHSLLFLNHTNLKKIDLEALTLYLNNNELKGFSIEDFKTRKKWDILKIKGFKRYKLEIMANQPIKSPYIGMVQISSMSFNKEINNAIVYSSFLCAGNGDCAAGLIYHLKKSDKWEIKKVEILLVS